MAVQKAVADAKKNILSFPIHEYWLDIGQMEEYKKAQKEKKHFRTKKNFKKKAKAKKEREAQAVHLVATQREPLV